MNIVISPQVIEIREILKESLTLILEFPELGDFSCCMDTALNGARQPEGQDFKLEMTTWLEACVHEIERSVQAATDELKAIQEAEEKRVDRIAQFKFVATELQQVSESVIARWSSPGALGGTELRAAMLSFSPTRLPGDPLHIFWEESHFCARWAEVEKSLQFISGFVTHSRDDAQQRMVEILERVSSPAAKSSVTVPRFNVEAFPSPQKCIEQSIEFYRVGSWWQFWRYEARTKDTPNLEKARAEITRYVHEMSRTLLDHLHR